MINMYLSINTNNDYGKTDHLPDFSVIDIGAVIVDDSCERPAEFHSLVKPVSGKALYPLMVDYLNITNTEIEQLPTLVLVMRALTEKLKLPYTAYVWSGFEKQALLWSIEQSMKYNKFKQFTSSIKVFSDVIKSEWQLEGTPVFSIVRNVCHIEEPTGPRALAKAKNLQQICERYKQVSKDNIKFIDKYADYVSAHSLIWSAKDILSGSSPSFLDVANSNGLMSFQEFLEYKFS